MERPTIAIVGASGDRDKFGNKAIRAYQSQGYQVFPVNPAGGEIEGLVAYASLGDVPQQPLDRIALYVPPAIGLKLLPEISRVGCGELWVNPGAESDELLAEAERLGLNVVQACAIVDLGANPAQL